MFNRCYCKSVHGKLCRTDIVEDKNLIELCKQSSDEVDGGEMLAVRDNLRILFEMRYSKCLNFLPGFAL
jgi:hypothetical protein